MPGGLSLAMGGRFGARGGVNTGSQPATAPGGGPNAFQPAVAPAAAATLAPNDPVGIGLWASVGALGFLVLLRHSLPSNMKRLFDLDLMILVGGHLASGVVRMENRRLAASGGPIGQLVGGAGNIVLGS